MFIFKFTLAMPPPLPVSNGLHKNACSKVMSVDLGSGKS